jgi:hypothetical protein
MRAEALLMCLLVVALAIGVPASAETKDYAYLMIQGRISDPAARDPMAGATVTLTSPAGTFQATTDRYGVFVFDKLPVSSYDVDITNAEGKVVRSARQIDPGDPDRSRVELRMGRREATDLRLETQEKQVVLIASEPPFNWGRFGKQVGIFIGIVALLFAL